MIGNSVSRLFYQLICIGTALLGMTGCERSEPPVFRFNSVEWVKQEKTHLADGEHFPEDYKTEIGTIVTALFGTPDDPTFPFFLGDEDPAHDVISIESLRMAAGPTRVDKRESATGLYREHCAHCHGITGNGAGDTAASLEPYPRDFRLGKFKFKSTPLRSPPTDHDLTEILVNGIPGSAMPSFRTLPEDQIQSLVEYVKYLTIRGQFERFLLGELAALDGEPLIDLSLVDKPDGGEPSEDDVEEFEDQMYAVIGEGLQERIIARWLRPERKVTKIEAAPPEFDIQHQAHRQFVQKGRELYFAKGNCMQCHGDTGIGDGQLNNFDDWTNDWIKSADVDTADPTSYADFSAVGALPPRPVKPRNLTHRYYRGGDHPDDLYMRLRNGIEGTPMPASTAMTSDEIWAVVAYVRAMPYLDSTRDESEKPVNEKQVMR